MMENMQADKTAQKLAVVGLLSFSAYYFPGHGQSAIYDRRAEPRAKSSVIDWIHYRRSLL
jgi:hypothetical protein